MENVRVALWGFGAMGSGVAQLLLKKQGVEIVAVCGRSSNVGKDIYELLGLERGNRQPLIIGNQPEIVFPPELCGCHDPDERLFYRKGFRESQILR